MATTMDPFQAAMAGAARQQRVKEIVGDDRVREKRCMNEIDIVLQRFDCIMVPEVTIGGGRIASSVRIQAMPRMKKEVANG